MIYSFGVPFPSRHSPNHDSPDRHSPDRHSPIRTSPHRTMQSAPYQSEPNTSPRRTIPHRHSPRHRSPHRHSRACYDWTAYSNSFLINIYSNASVHACAIALDGFQIIIVRGVYIKHQSISIFISLLGRNLSQLSRPKHSGAL